MAESVPRDESRRQLADVVIELDRKIHGEDYDPRRSRILAEALLASDGELFTEDQLEELRQQYSELDN